MVQIAGKYELVESKNFKEVLVRGGFSEEKAKQIESLTTVLEVTVDGNKIKLQSDEKLKNHTTELILGEEVDEQLLSGTIKSTATLDGNVLKIVSKGADGKLTGTRTYTFTDSGLQIEYVSTGDNNTAQRIYKRL